MTWSRTSYTDWIRCSWCFRAVRIENAYMIDWCGSECREREIGDKR